MSDPVLKLPIESSLNESGFKQTEAWLKRLRALQQQKPASQGGDPFAPMTAGAQKAAVASQRLATETARTATASSQAAVASQKLATEQQRTAAAASSAAAAQTRAEQAALRLAQAQNQVGKGAAVLPRTIAGLSHEAAAAAKGMLGLGAAITVVNAVVDKAEQAFQWKATLDATTASINAQLNGVRDLSQVYAGATAFGQEFKLTQMEQAQAIQGAIGVIRQSKAPIEDILSVLARMQVLSPEQSLQEAAVALKALAGGDTQSLVTRFEVSRDVATQMKNEIAGGADAVAVMSKFLNDSGIGMDALKAKTEGAAGAIKDAAIQQERLLAAIAGEKGGLGLALIQAKTTATQGLANALSSNSDALYAAAKAQDGAYNAALARGATEAEAAKVALEAYEETLRRLTPVAELAAPALDAASEAALAAADAARQHTSGMLGEINAAIAAEAAHRAEAAALGASTLEAVNASVESQTLAAQQEFLEQAAIRAADGQNIAGDAAGFLARQFGITTGQADDLIGRLRQLAQLQNTLAFGRATKVIGSVGVGEFLAGERAKVKGEIGGIADRLGRGAGDFGPRATPRSAGRAGGGAARETAAEKTGNRLADIERTSGNKLADIQEQTQQKLAQIDAKYAEQRIRAVQSLNDEIARTSAENKYENELNDFDQFGKDMTDAQRAAFAAREQAEFHYNERIAAAQDEARNEAVNGDADFAKDRLKIREDQAKRQQQIEERAAQANIDTGGKQTAAVAQQAAEATKANEDQANTEIAIAQAKSQEKGKAQADEKQAVVDAAETQRQDVIKKAQDTASAVKGASDDQKKTVVDNLAKQAQAAKDWADAIVNASNTVQTAMGSVTGPPTTTTGGEAPPGDTEAAGGGTFVTRGPTTLTVGDNPGGAELVTVTPLSGRGTTRVGGRMARMAGGGALLAGGGDSPTIAGAISTFTDAAAIINILKPFVAANKGVLALLNQYKSIVTAAVGSLVAIQDLRERMVMPSPVLDPVAVLKLKDDVELVLNMMIAIDASAIKKIGVFAKYLTTEKSAIEILTQMQDLRSKLATPTPPIDVAYVQALMRDSQAVLDLLLGSFIPLKQHLVDDLKRYADTEGAAIQILSGVADLRKQLTEGSGTAFDIGLLRGLAKRASDITRMVQLQLVPVTEDQAAMLQRYADAAGAAVSILGDVADLRKQLSEGSGTPFDMNLLRGLAMRAAQILQLVQAQLIPTTEATAAGMQRYADAAGSAVSVLGGTADLRKQLSELTGGPFDMRLIAKLAAEAQQITRIVQAVLVPETEAEADGLSAYASAVGSAVGIVRDVASLRKDAAELAAPVPVAAITALAGEAKRITQIVQGVLVPTTEDQAGGFSRYGEAVSASVGVVRDVASLRKDATDLAGPIPEKAVIALADDAKRITQIVMARMVPASEEQAAAARRFADTEGAAIQALKSVLEMPARLFADYQSPSNAEIDMAVKDANRIVQCVDQAARLYDTKGLDAAKLFSEAVGGTFTAFKDGLLFFEALNSGDFRPDPKNLAVFEQGMAQTMAVAGRLGAQAVAIPAANITALQNVTAALTSAYDSMIRLAAVPAGNLGALAGGFGGAGGGGQSIIVNINNPPANMNVPMTIQQIKQGLAQGFEAKR